MVLHSGPAVVFSWSPPQDSGWMGTVFYTVYYQALISGSLRMTWDTVTTTSVSVTNLLPATEHRMTVVMNDLPSAPEGLNIDTTAVVLSWSPPQDSGGPRLSENVWLCVSIQIALFATLQATQAPGDGSSECQNPPFIKTPFPSNIVMLMDSYDYLYLTVVVGGPWSTLDVDGDTRTIKGAVIDLLERPPSAPQNLTMGTISATAVVLSWSPPQDSGGMGTVFYTVYYQALISGSLRMTWGNFYTTSVTVTNLLPATEYRMTVVAQNGLPGDGGKQKHLNTFDHSKCILKYAMLKCCPSYIAQGVLYNVMLILTTCLLEYWVNPWLIIKAFATVFSDLAHLCFKR
eukprot:Em0008g172a